jgi:hypothetical protein
MPWSGGTFTRANGDTGWASDAGLGIGIEAGRHDNQDNDFKNGINECLNKTGQNAMAGTLSMGTNKISNLAAGTLRNDAAQVGQIQNDSGVWCGASGGSANAQTITPSPAITAYTAGQRFTFIAAFTNTGNTTLNVNGLGAKSLLNSLTGGQLSPGNMTSNLICHVIYDGTLFQLLNPQSSWTSFTPVWGQTNVITFTTNYSKYTVVGKVVHYQVSLVATNSGTAGAAITVSVPVANASANIFRTVGAANFFDQSTATMYQLSAYAGSPTTVSFIGDSTAGNNFGTIPAVTIAAGDYINFAITYEV